MAIAARFREASYHALRAAGPVACIAVALCGCSINLGLLTPSAEKEEPPRLVSSGDMLSLGEAEGRHAFRPLDMPTRRCAA